MPRCHAFQMPSQHGSSTGQRAITAISRTCYNAFRIEPRRTGTGRTPVHSGVWPAPRATDKSILEIAIETFVPVFHPGQREELDRHRKPADPHPRLAADRVTPSEDTTS